MNNAQELEAVKKRIRALANMTPDKGASEAEALFAMKKVGELLLQYNLSMDMVAVREEPCVTKSFQTGSKHRDTVWYVYNGIQRLCGVKCWMSRYPEGIKWSFFGLESDVDMAIYLCHIVSSAEVSSLATFKKSDVYKQFSGHRKIASNNFLMGFGNRLNTRLLMLAKESEAEEKKAHEYHAEEMKARGITASDDAYKTHGTALICVEKARRVEEEFKARGPKLRTTRSYSKARYSFTAQDAGNAAANNVNLSRPVGNGTKNAGYLT